MEGPLFHSEASGHPLMRATLGGEAAVTVAVVVVVVVAEEEEGVGLLGEGGWPLEEVAQRRFGQACLSAAAFWLVSCALVRVGWREGVLEKREQG